MITYRDFSSFTTLYNKAKKDYPSLVDLNQNEINDTQKLVDEKFVPANTNRYLIVISCAAMVIAITTYLYLFNIKSYITLIINYLTEHHGKYSHSFVYNISLVIESFGCVLLCYVFFLPMIFKIKGFPFNRFGVIDKKLSQYILYSILTGYIVLGSILLFCYFNLVKYLNVVYFIGEVYITMSFIAISIFLFSIVILFSMLPFLKGHSERLYENKRLYICLILLNLLKEIENYNSFCIMDDNTSKNLIRYLYRVSRLIKNYSSGVLIIKPINEPILEIDKASNAFNEIIVDFLATNDRHVSQIKEKLVLYLNIFLSGSLSDLPKSELSTEMDIPPKRIRFFHFLFLIGFLAVPILVIIILNTVFNIKINDYIQTLLKILYLIWALTGLITSPIITNNENKEFIKDILKSIFGKG